MKKKLFRGISKKTGDWVYGSHITEYDGTEVIYFWVSELVEPENNYKEMVNVSHEVYPETVGQLVFEKRQLPKINEPIPFYVGDIVSVYGQKHYITMDERTCKFNLGIIYPDDHEFGLGIPQTHRDIPVDFNGVTKIGTLYDNYKNG